MRLFELNIGSTPTDLQTKDIRLLAEMTEGYSGSDISVAVRDGLFEVVRKVQGSTHFKRMPKPEGDGKEMGLTPCSPGDAGAIEMSWDNVSTEELILPISTVKDFIKAVKSSRPTVNAADNQKYLQFTEDYGSEGR